LSGLSSAVFHKTLDTKLGRRTYIKNQEIADKQLSRTFSRPFPGDYAAFD
jgi:hypothetical protein